MKAPSHINRNETGAALIVSLIILVVVTLIGLSGIQIVGQEERMSSNTFDRGLGFQGAESALRVGEDIAKAQAATVPPNTGFPDNGEYSDAGDTCPGTPSPCESGLCAKPDKDCTPRWMDAAFEGWADVSGVDLGTLSTTPQYFVEYLGNNFPCNTNDPTAGAFDCKRYRITARSGSSGDRASVILQSIFATE